MSIGSVGESGGLDEPSPDDEMTDDRNLTAVRAEIDSIDDAIHELIIRRTELVENVRKIKRDWPIKIQPAREAEIVYRLLARHHGPFPRRELVAIWRQLIVATLSFEGPFSIAAYTPDDDNGCWDVARDHFGMFTTIARHGSVHSVIEAVRRQEVTAGVLPLPRADDADPWWRHVVSSHADAPKVIARLPFAGPTNARDGAYEALAICPVTVAPTERDRTLLVAETDAELTVKALNAALGRAEVRGMVAAQWREPERGRFVLFLIEAEGYVAPGDPRLDELRAALGKRLPQLLWLGAYALPLTVEELGPAAFLNAPFTRAPRGEPQPT